MSVPKNERSESKVAFYFEGKRLAEKIIKFLMRDFGIKTVNRDLRAFTYNARMSEEDRKEFITLSDKYHIDIESNYPHWIIEKFRNEILDSLFNFLDSITLGYSIFPNTVYEVNIRRKYQNDAIGYMETVLNKLTILIELFFSIKTKVDVEKYMPFVEDINKEIANIKKWIKYCKAQNQAIQNREFLNNINSFDSSTNFITHAISQTLNATGIIIPVDFKLDLDKLKSDCKDTMEDKKKEAVEKAKLKEEKRKKKESKSKENKFISSSSSKNVEVPIPEIKNDSEPIKVVCNNFIIPEYKYNNDFETKIFVGHTKEGAIWSSKLHKVIYTNNIDSKS